MVGTFVSLAVSCAGATLVAYGVWTMHHPTGLIIGGIAVYLLQWSHEKDREVER